jgi:hypothetical protein
MSIPFILLHSQIWVVLVNIYMMFSSHTDSHILVRIIGWVKKMQDTIKSLFHESNMSKNKSDGTISRLVCEIHNKNMEMRANNRCKWVAQGYHIHHHTQKAYYETCVDTYINQFINPRHPGKISSFTTWKRNSSIHARNKRINFLILK